MPASKQKYHVGDTVCCFVPEHPIGNDTPRYYNKDRTEQGTHTLGFTAQMYALASSGRQMKIARLYYDNIYQDYVCHMTDNGYAWLEGWLNPAMTMKRPTITNNSMKTLLFADAQR